MGKPAPIEGLDHDTPLEEAARKSIAARLADVRRFEDKMAADVLDADDVHDMRVASRRLRAALQLFDRKRELRAAHDAVKALGDALGEVREIHVQVAWLSQAAESASDKEKPGIEALRAEREARLPKRIEGVRAALASWTNEGVALVEAAAGGLNVGGRLGGNRVRRRLTRRLKGIKQRVGEAAKSADARTAHQLRIGVKKLRYAAELSRPAFPSDLDALLDHLQPLQETLGELHDADVHIPVVEKFLVRADGTAQPGALALLRAEMTRRDKKAAALAEAIERFRGERIVEHLRDALC